MPKIISLKAKTIEQAGVYVTVTTRITKELTGYRLTMVESAK